MKLCYHKKNLFIKNFIKLYELIIRFQYIQLYLNFQCLFVLSKIQINLDYLLGAICAIAKPLHDHVTNYQLQVFGDLHVINCEM